jgi:putative ABC transport system substrate-binding protein
MCEIISVLVGFTIFAILPCTALAQKRPQATRTKRIGLVSLGFPATNAPQLAELRKGLRERGWIEGKNIIIELRYAEGNLERLAELAAELVRLPVDVLVTASVPATLVLKRATQTIPILVSATDPAGTGLVSPGGNVAAFGDPLPPSAASKQLDVLREVVPRLNRMALVWNGSNPAGQLNARRAREAAQAAGIQVIPVEVQGQNELEAALAGLRDKGAQAIFLVSDPNFDRKRVGSLTTATGLPAVCQERDWADGGCVITYGADGRLIARQGASYVDQVLRGTRPADLPIGPTPGFELVINASSAKAMGLTIPRSVLRRADAVLP